VLQQFTLKRYTPLTLKRYTLPLYIPLSLKTPLVGGGFSVENSDITTTARACADGTRVKGAARSLFGKPALSRLAPDTETA
jgi:hypothetical protein